MTGSVSRGAATFRSAGSVGTDEGVDVSVETAGLVSAGFGVWSAFVLDGEVSSGFGSRGL
jgi:hypothetical protein